MAVLPKIREDQIAFFEARLAKWAEGPGAIGLDGAFVAGLGEKVAAARESLRELETIRARAESATVAFENAWRGMIEPGRDAVRTIKAFAELTGDPGVYVDSDIPPPAGKGAPSGPGLPRDFRFELDQRGRVSLRWKCNNPTNGGTTYLVERRVCGAGAAGEDGGWMLLGTVGGRKRFTDETAPAGAARIDYRITGQRAGIAGPAAIFTLRMGVAEAPRAPRANPAIRDAASGAKRAA